MSDAFGLKQLKTPEEASVDIVAIHGLDGHRDETWTAENKIMWLEELLPREVPRARIMTYGYDARTHSSEHLIRQTLYGHAVTLVTTLSLYRRRTKTDRRPIIFVAHSLGGIVVKSALIHANMAGEGHNDHHKAIKTSTYGILFFGTPHSGANGVSLGKVLLNVVSIGHHTNDRLIKHLEEDSEWLEIQSRQYNSISADFDTKFCYETFPTPTVGGRVMMIVSRSSAVVGGARNAEEIEIRKNHKTMVKFEDKSDDDFQTVAAHISIMCEAAPELVAENWTRWERMQDVIHNRSDRAVYPPMKLRYSRNQMFTGRLESLKQLHGLILEAKADTNRSSVIVVHGIGGVGKTQLVLEYAYTHEKELTFVVWINAQSAASAQRGFLDFASQLIECHAKGMEAPNSYAKVAQQLGMVSLVDGEGHIDMVNCNTTRIVDAVKAWLSGNDTDSWLIIFDGIDDLESMDISHFFINASNGCHVLTSRRPESSRLGHAMNLEGMVETESVALLSRSSQRKIDIADPRVYGEAKRIVSRLGFLPLAIDQAGAYLRTSSKPLETYLPLLEENFKWILSKKPTPALWQYEDVVFSTWEVSYQAIHREDCKATQLLTLCSYLSNDHIGISLITKGLKRLGWDALQVDDFISTILSFSLATRKETNDSLYIHPLVHWWARERLDLNMKQEAAALAMSVLGAGLDALEIGEPKFMLEVMPHIEMLLPITKSLWPSNDRPDRFWPLWYAFGFVYRDLEEHNTSKELFEFALEGCRKARGEDDPMTLNTMVALATTYGNLDELEKAEAMFAKGLESQEKQLREGDPQTLSTIHYLAIAKIKRERLSEAEELLERVLVGYEREYGPDSLLTMPVVRDLAACCGRQGQYDRAESMFHRAITVYEKELEPDHHNTLETMIRFAEMCRMKKDFETAKKLYTRVKQAYDAKVGTGRSQYLGCISGLADANFYTGQFSEAEELFQTVLVGYEDRLGIDDLETLSTAHNLGVVFLKTGKIADAELLLRRAMTGRLKQLGPTHPATERSKQELEKACGICKEQQPGEGTAA